MDTTKIYCTHLYSTAQALHARDQHAAQCSIKLLFLVYRGLCVTFCPFVGITSLGNLAFLWWKKRWRDMRRDSKDWGSLRSHFSLLQQKEEKLQASVLVAQCSMWKDQNNNCLFLFLRLYPLIPFVSRGIFRASDSSPSHVFLSVAQLFNVNKISSRVSVKPVLMAPWKFVFVISVRLHLCLWIMTFFQK